MSKATPPHLNRGLQLRMLSFVGLFAIVLIVFTWFQARRSNPGPMDNVGRSSASLAERSVRDRQNGNRLGDDAFLSPPDLQARDNSLVDRPVDWKEPPPLEEMPGEETVQRDIARRETKFDKRILDKVQDNTIGIRREEADPYYRLLDHARRVSPTELDQAGLTDVLYINLMDEPDRFRGEPIKIHGDLFRLRRILCTPNAQGIKVVYEGWIFTADSSNHPYRVVCTSIPPDFELKDDLRKPVEVTGYFFKREGYASNGGMHVGPTMLANRIESYRAPGAPPDTDAIVPYMIGFVSAVGLAFLVTLVSFTISDRRAARLLLERKKNDPVPSFSGIDGPSATAVEETLRMFAEQELVDARQSLAGKDPAVLLHARDHAPNHHVDPPVTNPSEEDSAERLRVEGQALQTWATNHHAHGQRDSDKSKPDEQKHEQREADQVLSQLASSEQIPPEQTDDSESETEEEEIEDLNGETLVDSPRQDSESDPVPPVPFEEVPAHEKGYSRLAAWEQEIEQFAAQPNPSRSDFDGEQLAAQSEVERDLRTRDRELHDRLRSQKPELDGEQLTDELD